MPPSDVSRPRHGQGGGVGERGREREIELDRDRERREESQPEARGRLRTEDRAGNLPTTMPTTETRAVCRSERNTTNCPQKALALADRLLLESAIFCEHLSGMNPDQPKIRM